MAGVFIAKGGVFIAGRAFWGWRTRVRFADLLVGGGFVLFGWLICEWFFRFVCGLGDDVFGHGLEFLKEGFGAAFGFEGFAGLVGEAALARDIGVLKGVGPGADLAGAGFGEGHERGELGVDGGIAGAEGGEVELGARFAGGAAGDIEEVEKFGRCAAFEAFCDVVGNRERTAAELIDQVAALAEAGVVGECVDSEGEILGVFPDGQVFETMVRHALLPE